MSELVLDRSTVWTWWAAFGAVVGFLWLSLAGLGFALGKRRSRALALLFGFLCGVSILAVFYIALSPYAHYRVRVGPGIALGERVYARYETYKADHGRYPASIAEVYFADLDYFDRVEGVRDRVSGCDGAGVGCKAIDVSVDGELIVFVYDGLIACQITAPARGWSCRDQR